ncbi:MAG TPA: hypothetical protein VE544_12310 [Nitrososphaeraceae archaeon]|jgi:hypothetical protein|nr:hypothetical protein [Nitrososphaeraceae archaeon]
MKLSLSDRKKKLDGFDKSFGPELYVGASKEDSRLRMTLSDGFDRELSLAEKAFARGDYLDALGIERKLIGFTQPSRPQNFSILFTIP